MPGSATISSALRDAIPAAAKEVSTLPSTLNFCMAKSFSPVLIGSDI
ncbi:MAG: hypothetical protein ACI87N_002559 [Flavobacteriales bacterium]